MKKMITLLFIALLLVSSTVVFADEVNSTGLKPEQITTYSLGVKDGKEYFLTKLKPENVDLSKVAYYLEYKYPTREIVESQVVSREYKHIGDVIEYTEVIEQRITETHYQYVKVIGATKNGELGVFNLPLTPTPQFYKLRTTQTQTYKLCD